MMAVNLQLQYWADLGFSRRGFKKISMLRPLQKHSKDPVSAKVLVAQAKLKKKQSKKGVLSHFLEHFDQKKIIVSARAPPSKLVYIDVKGPIRKLLESVIKHGYLKIVHKGQSSGK